MTQKLGICIVGSGFMGQTHARGWQAVPEAQIVAVVDSLPARAQALARQVECEAYSDYAQAIARPDVDVVSICIPTYLHVEVTVAAAALGKHILCEKPIALSLADADQMIVAAAENQVKLGVGFMRRHTPVLVDLRVALAAGTLGRPVLYHATDVRELRPKREMHDVNANGGPVIDMAVHLIDVWNAIFDSAPVSVSAQGLTLGENRPEIGHIAEKAVDTATLLVKYASGDIGSFTVCWGLPAKVNPEQQRDQIYAPHGLVELYFSGNQQEIRIMQENGVWQTTSISHQDMYGNQIQAFTDWVLKDKPFPAQGEAGKLALEVALAALEAIRTGQTVNL